MSKQARNLQRREQWFRKGAEALEGLFPQYGGLYCCPLCLRLYPQSAIQAKILTDEDVPPKSQGGREMVLTCEPCNSRAGHSVDNHANNYEKNLDFFAGKMERPGRGKLTVGSSTANVELRFDDNGIVVIHLPDGQHNPPGTWEKVSTELWQLAGPGDLVRGGFSISLDGSYHHRRALVSWLRSAYLVAFAELGYRYILSTGLDLVREQINHPGSDVLRVMTLIEPKQEKTERHLFVIGDPDWLNGCLAVVMGRHTVILPEPWSRYSPYGRMAEESAAGRKLAIRPMAEVNWPTSPVFAFDFANWDKEVGGAESA